MKGNRALATAYIDARLVEDRLDEVVGVGGWQDSYDVLPEGSVVCRLSLKINGEWVTKTDVGSPSEQPDAGDRTKASFSDALKRAAVKFGIGRYLYRLPALWADYDPAKKQFVSTPLLPAFAIPAPKGKGGPPAAKPAPEPNLPKDGHELHQRLRDYDAKLAAQRIGQAGDLLKAVAFAGKEAGFGPDLTTWAGPAIPFAVQAVKNYEKRLAGQPKKPSPIDENPPKPVSTSDADTTGAREEAEISAAEEKDRLLDGLYEMADKLDTRADTLIALHRGQLGLNEHANVPKTFGELSMPRMRTMYTILRNSLAS